MGCNKKQIYVDLGKWQSGKKENLLDFMLGTVSLKQFKKPGIEPIESEK